MRALTPLALMLGGCGAASSAVPLPTARPQRVMSINLCTDQLVLALVPRTRIASVSWLARDASGSLLAAQARAVPVNHGSAEEVLAQRPDLVVAGPYGTPALRAMLRRLGYPLVEVAEATDLAGIRRITRQVAAAVGERARGEALIADMDAGFAALARDAATPVRVAMWDRSGFGAGPGTLSATLLTAAGASTVAAGSGAPDLEALLRADPALLIQGTSAAASLGDDVARHRLVRRLWGPRTVIVPQTAYACGTPMIAAAALRLRAQLRGATRRIGSAGPIG